MAAFQFKMSHYPALGRGQEWPGDLIAAPFDEADDMCPNCVTPWKCNGPHLNDQTPFNLHRSDL